jgi:DNA primase
LRQTDQVIFSFDGDSAGRRAARRALEASLPHAGDNKVIKFLFLPSEHDPDSFIRELGAEAFEKQVHDAMPLSQFLLNQAIGDNDLNTPEGRARTQFDAKPMLQALPPSALRLQIVRGLAQVTESTPAEIEALFELAQPVSTARRAPPRSRRTAPVGLERQIMRLLVAHPALAMELDQAALDAVSHVAPDNAEMLAQLVHTGQELGAHANFATLAELLRSSGSDFDPLIAEIAAEPESNPDAARLELAGAIRQSRMKVLRDELERLVAGGLGGEQAQARYRELSMQQEQLRREAQAEIARRD